LTSCHVIPSLKASLTHYSSKDISKDECPNADPQDDVDLRCDGISNFDKISEDIIPVIQGEELKKGDKCVTKGAETKIMHS